MAHIEAFIENKLHVFDLPVGFSFNLKKNNPLFTDLGSQTAPLELPLSPRNNVAMGFPARIDGYFKPRTNIPVTIVDGIFRKQCTLRIAGADQSTIKGTIYFDEGEAYERIKNVKLTELELGGFRVPDGTLATQIPYNITMLHFLHRIFINRETHVGYNIDNTDFDIFEVSVHYEDENKLLFNEITDTNIRYRTESRRLPGKDENGNTIQINTGTNYGITPFLRVHALLRLIFESIGYKLTHNPFATHPQLSKLVVLNNTADTIVNNAINYRHIIPDCTVNDFLDSLWAKFGAKLFLNSDTKEAKIYLVKDILKTTPRLDLTEKLTSPVTRTFAIPKQLCLIPQTSMIDNVVFKSYQEFSANNENVVKYEGTLADPTPPLTNDVFLRLLDGNYLQYTAFGVEFKYKWNSNDITFSFSEPVKNVHLVFRFKYNNQADWWDDSFDVYVNDFSGESGAVSVPFYDNSQYLWNVEVFPNPNGIQQYFFEGEVFNNQTYLSAISSAQLAWIPENKELENEELQAKDESYAVETGVNNRIAPIYKTSLRHRNTILRVGSESKEENLTENKILFTFGFNRSAAGIRSGNFMPFSDAEKIAGWDFGLIYAGDFGLYKHFFEEYDQFLHHANEPYECAMKLSKIEYMQLRNEEPVLIHGQPCLIEDVEFPFGEDGDAKVTLRSLRLMNEPSGVL